MIQKKIQVTAILFFIFLSCIAGIFGVLSNIYNFQLLRLWKEIYIGLLVFLIFGMSYRWLYTNNYFKQAIGMSIGAIIFFVFESIYSLSLPINIIVYQLKIDVPVVAFGIICWIFIIQFNKQELVEFAKKVVFIILGMGLINAVAIIYERLFPHEFTSMLGLNWGNWGNSAGIRIITTNGNIRAMGLLTSFVASGTLMLICFVLLIETKKLLKFNKYLFIALAVMFIVCLYFSTYKTAIIGFVFYLVLKILPYIFKKHQKFAAFTFASFMYLIFFASGHFYFIYRFVSKFSESMAYNSIYLRIFFHRQIIDQLHSLSNVLFGVGMGRNGTFGIDKNLYNIKAIPTDSTYIYLVSNYGYVSVGLFTLFSILILRYLFKYNKYDIIGARYLMLYTLCIEFYYNNFMANFPANLFVIILSTISVVYTRLNLESQKV